jgi:glutathione S-transferase
LKLIGSNTSPYVRKVRIVLAEKAIACEYVQEDVWAATTTIGRYNPIGKVPTLLLDDGEPVIDSRVIAEYLDTLGAGPRLLPPHGTTEFLKVKTWEAVADGALDAALLARMEATWPPRGDAQRNAPWIDRQLCKIDAALLTLDIRLPPNGFCLGGALSLADIAAGTLLGYLDFRYPQIDWRERHPGLLALWGRLEARPSFVQTRPT